MSLIRPIFNDGVGLTTPDTQRPADVGSNADDRVFEALVSPGTLLKKVMPVSEESPTTYPRTLVAPGSTAGTVQLNPALLVAGTAVGVVGLSAQTAAVIASPLVTANASGNPRIDSVYATISRTVPPVTTSPPVNTAYAGLGVAALGSPASGQATRRIKDSASGALSSQLINIYDVPTVVITILPGTPAGSPVAPTIPADSATSFNFSLATIAVANGYTSGTTITAANITQTWSGGWIQPQRIHAMRPMGALYSGSSAEKPAGTALSERWGSSQSFFAHFVLNASSPTTNITADVLDNSIDWRGRVLFITLAYLGLSTTRVPFETTGVSQAGTGVTISTYLCPNAGGFGIALTYGGSSLCTLFIDTSGQLKVSNQGTLITASDLLVLKIDATDRFLAGM